MEVYYSELLFYKSNKIIIIDKKINFSSLSTYNVHDLKKKINN